MVETSPSGAGGAGSTPGWGAGIPHASRPRSQGMEWRQYCSKFNEDFKNGPHFLKKSKNKQSHIIMGLFIYPPVHSFSGSSSSAFNPDGPEFLWPHSLLAHICLHCSQKDRMGRRVSQSESRVRGWRLRAQPLWEECPAFHAHLGRSHPCLWLHPSSIVQ